MYNPAATHSLEPILRSVRAYFTYPVSLIMYVEKYPVNLLYSVTHKSVIATREQEKILVAAFAFLVRLLCVMEKVKGSY
jgi:hypothetical protein